MSLDADLDFQRQRRDRNANRWLERFRDRAEVVARDGARLARDRAAMTASVGRAQMERAQSFVAFHAQRRPLLVMGLALGVGLLLGAALSSSATRNRT